MQVHNELKNGWQEVVYQRALALEFRWANINFEREKEMQIHYKNGCTIGTRRVDFFVEETICVELKALSEMTKSNMTQAKNYLEGFRQPIGLLINFGAAKLEYKRLYNNKLLSKIK